MTLYILLFQHQKRILITNIVIIISSILLIVNVSLLQAKSTSNNIDDIISISTDGNIEHNYVPLSIQNFNNRFSRLAIQKMNEKDYLLAKIFFSKARLQDPWNYRHWNDLGILFLRSGQILDAHYNFKRAMKMINEEENSSNNQNNKTIMLMLKNDKNIITNTYQNMKNSVMTTINRKGTKCDALLDDLKYIKAIKCLKDLYVVKDLITNTTNKQQFQKIVLDRMRYGYFNIGYAENALDICNEISIMEGNKLTDGSKQLCDSPIYQINLLLNICVTKFIKNGGSFPLLKYVNNPCRVFSPDNIMDTINDNQPSKKNDKSLKTKNLQHPFFKCIMLAAQNTLAKAIACAENILNILNRQLLDNAKNDDDVQYIWDKSLMSPQSILRTWYVRQSSKVPSLIASHYQHSSFFLRGKIFVLNRKKRGYRKFQAKKVLSRLELGIPLTFVNAIDKDEIEEEVLKSNGNVVKGLGNVLNTHKLSHIFKIEAEEIAYLKPTYGEIGCALSHIYLWQKLLDSKHPFAIVFEDDAIIKGDLERYEREVGNFISRELQFLSLNSDLPSKIQNWDYLHLGACKRTPLENFILPPFLSQSDFNFCTHAYVISRNGAKKLLQLTSKYNAVPIDNFLTWAWGKPLKIDSVTLSMKKNVIMYSDPDDYLLESEKINSFVLGTRLIPFTQFNIKDGSQHGGFSDVTPGHNKQQN